MNSLLVEDNVQCDHDYSEGYPTADDELRMCLRQRLRTAVVVLPVVEQTDDYGEGNEDYAQIERQQHEVRPVYRRRSPQIEDARSDAEHRSNR